MHHPGRRIDFSTGQRNIIRIIHVNESSTKGPGFEPFSTQSWLTLFSTTTGTTILLIPFLSLNTRDDRCKLAARKRIALLTNWKFPSNPRFCVPFIALADSVRYVQVKPLRISRVLSHRRKNANTCARL